MDFSLTGPSTTLEACGAYLLLRQGKVVALVGCNGVDLTSPENLAVIRARLSLPTS